MLPYLQQSKYDRIRKYTSCQNDLRKKIILVYILRKYSIHIDIDIYTFFSFNILIRDQTTLNQCYTYRLLHSL